MKRKEIERNLNKIISENVPNVLDNILTRCENKKGKNNMKEEQEKTRKKISFKLPALVGAVALVIICLGFGGYNYYYNIAVDSIIDMDVNPSVEIKINRHEKVISANALNQDGKIVLADMDLEKVDLDVAVNAVIGSMVKNGYISEIQNSILVTVQNKDAKKAQELENKVSKNINELLTGKNIDGAIITQKYEETKDVDDLAEKYKISEGKAYLITKIINSGLKDSKGNAYTFENLAKLSINELQLLLSDKKAEVNDVSSSGTTSQKSVIGKDAALNIALTKANAQKVNVTNIKVQLDSENGVLVYEVEFDFGTNEYEYEINAKDGQVIKSDIEKIDKDYDDIYDDNDFDDDRYDDDGDRYDDDDDDDRYDD